MMKKIHMFMFLFLAIAVTAKAQTYPTTSWIDVADTSWFDSSQDEFTLSTAEELAGLSQLVIDGNTFVDKTIIIDADIDLDGNLWTPIGADNTLPFSGTVQGNDHIISNLWINLPSDDYIGLFGFVSTSSLSNIHVDTSHIVGLDNVGTLVANLFDNGAVENCSAINVSVTGNNNTGGLVGGFLTNSSISKSHAIGDVTGAVQVGGVAGTGWDKIEMTECYSEGTVTGGVLVGGLVGAFTFSFGEESTIDNSYSRSTVVADSEKAGGLIGGADNALLVKNSYATGTVDAPDLAGAIIGLWGTISMENMYFDTESSGMTEGVGGYGGPPATPDITGKTTAEMKSTDMVALLNAGSGDDFWALDSSLNDGYPVLSTFLAVSDNQAEALSVAVYPTAFDTEFTVASKLDLQSYTIYSYSGALVLEGSLNGTTTITAGNLAAGVYILNISTEQGVITKRVIKK